MLSTRNKVRLMSVMTILAMLFSFANVSPVAAQDEAPPATPGIVEGFGIHFAVTDSDWLNVTLDSTAPIHINLNSSPKIILMNITDQPGPASTEITLGGLEPNTTYWRYDDDAHIGTQFTADASGNYTFNQDLTAAHTIRIQAGRSTYYIYDDGPSGTGGQCTAIGTWGGTSKTCTLTQNVNDSIYLYSTGVTLDGAGYTVTLPSWGSVQLSGDQLTVKNLTIQGTPDSYYGYPSGLGIYLYSAPNSTVTNVTVLDTYYGVYEYYSNNSVIQNSVFSGVAYGGYFQQTSNITISDNTFSAVAPSYYVNPYYGFYLWDIDSSTVRGNTISGFNNGVYIDGYSASYDYWNYGTHYVGSYDYSSSATVYQNNFVNVATPIIRPNWGYTYSFDYRPGTDSYGSYIYDTSNPGTVFNLAAPDGGNYYSQFDESAEGCNNTNSDSFCDSAFIGSGGAVDNLPWTTQDGWATPADTTAPVITYTLTPSTADGANGWYKSNVTLAWSVTDPESSVTMTGCVDQNILADQGATTYSCSASSAGGSSGPVDVSIKRDATVPTVSLVGGPANGGSYYFGSVPAAPTCSALDALSGLDGSCTVSDYSALVGPQTVIATANDNAGNQNSASAAYTVLAWTLNGFYQPVDMGGVWNTVKNGSTVPLKFEVFAGSTELTSTSIVNQPLTATQTLCSGGPTDEIEILASGATSLRYDTASGQFIYNWQTPKKAGYCYVVTVKLADGTSISANFKLK